MVKFRPTVRITKESLIKGLGGEGEMAKIMLRKLLLDVYDSAEFPLAVPPRDDCFVTFELYGEPLTLPRACVELIARYEVA